MPTINELKEQAVTSTPLFLFDCTLRSGFVERWASHAVTFEGNPYSARLQRHNLFEVRASSDEGFDGVGKISVTLANADSRYSQLERETGFRGAKVVVRMLFFDLAAGTGASEARVIFRGVGNAADEITEATLRVTFNNRLNLQRISLPEVRIGRRCPWLFPANADQRAEALDGGSKGKYSALYRCGYSADQVGGVGNLNSGVPFSTCDYTRAACESRGMFKTDSASRETRRFGGVEFVPAQILVRSHGEKGTHLSPVAENEARYNDVVPIVYGTAWYQPPIVFSRNDGNLTSVEMLLGMGQISDIVKVVVDDVEIPEAVNGADMTATGWYYLVTPGSRNGGFNPNFVDGSGNPLGDPYGSMAMASVVVPNRISNGQTLPKVQVLLRGLLLERFDENGISIGEAFTNNPAWVMLDVLRRSGWGTEELDLPSFARTAAYCAEPIEITDLYGNPTSIPRFQCNLVLRNRRSAAEVAKGIRAGSSLSLTYGNGGLLVLGVENSIALQQPEKPGGSNSEETLNGGWPAYEFSDGSAPFSGIVCGPGGEPTLRVSSRSGSDAANRYSVEFQDEFNEFQQDSLSLVDVDDALLTGRDVAASFDGLGLPNFNQAARMLTLQLAKSLRGNVFVDFETSVRGLGLVPGDLIAITYLKEGWTRQPFRIVRIAPGLNYQTVAITAQWHEDSWYDSGGLSASGGRRRPGSEVGLPRPLVGTVIDTNGIEQFGITETVIPTSDGSFSVKLAVEFSPPARPGEGKVPIPLLSLQPVIDTTGGSLAGGKTFYYAINGTDTAGSQSPLSFAIRAKIPDGTNTNKVTLTGLSFAPGTTTFNVYRGSTPGQLLRIAADVSVTASFTDTGLTAELVGPPDENFDHANLYWRWELQPEAQAGIHSATTIGNSTLGMLPDELKGSLVRINRGKGALQERVITGNTATTITVARKWTVEPDSSSYFSVAEGTWKFAGLGQSSPVDVEVPNRPGATVEVSGRSANVHDQESAYELNPLTAWQIGGGAGGTDSDVPPRPTFGLNLSGQGTLELLGVGFETLANTHTVVAGTLGLFYWNELNSPTDTLLSSGIDATQDTITLSVSGTAAVGTLIQIGAEILEVTEVLAGAGAYRVERGAYSSTAGAHAASTKAYVLTRGIFIVPFAKGFFGSPASGSYSHSIFLPNARVGAAEFFVTNTIGSGPVAKGSFGALVDQGLRTLSGGQLSIQIEGYLAIQDDAAPALVMETTRAVGDIFAIVKEAPDGGPIELTLRQDDTVYCTLTIADGNTTSNVVNGFGLSPLLAESKLSLDITAVPGAANTLPGRDLTVTVRL